MIFVSLATATLNIGKSLRLHGRNRCLKSHWSFALEIAGKTREVILMGTDTRLGVSMNWALPKMKDDQS